MPYYKAQHEVFIRAVIRHGDQLAAYRQAYPKASIESAYTAAIRLARQLHIKERIAAAMQLHAQQERQRAQEREEHKRRMAEEDTLQKRIWLARVVRGEVMKQRYMQFKGRTILLHETLSPFIILAAIELDTRYEYGTNPKIILDRQFARLYERAMRPVGLRWVNGSTQPPIKAVISTAGRNLPRICNRLHRSTSGDLPPVRKFSLHSASLHSVRNGEVCLAGKNTQNASKKLTDSNVNKRQAIHPASNIPAVCNKVKTHRVHTSAASVHRAETHVVILSEVECSSPSAVILSEVECSSPSAVILSEVECNETQRRICLIKDTATSKQILRDAQNDSFDGTASGTAESKQILRCAQNDSLDGATSDTAASRQILRDAQNDSFDGTTSAAAASKQITFGERVLRDAQNDSIGGIAVHMVNRLISSISLI